MEKDLLNKFIQQERKKELIKVLFILNPVRDVRKTK